MHSDVRVNRIVVASLALAAMNGVLVPATSAAQLSGGTGTRIGPVVRHTPPNNARQVAAQFGECVVKKHRPQAVQWLQAKTREERAKLQPQVFDGDCLEKEVEARDTDIELKLSAELAKFAIAEPLAREAIEAVDPSSLTKAPPLTYLAPDPAEFTPDSKKRPPTAKQIADAEKARLEANVDVAFEAYGECVVRQNPVASKQLLASPVSSDAETNAFGSLMPSFSECLPKNQQFTATKAMLRGTAALAFYRLTNAAQTQQQSAK